MTSNNFFEIPNFEASTPTEERFAGSDSEDLFMTDIRTSSEASDDVPGSALCTAHRFLKYLPNIELDEIPEDERQCGICQEPYGVDVQDEKIVQLPYCGHR